VSEIAETPTSPVRSQSSNDDDPPSNRSPGRDSQGVPYDAQSQQPSTSKADEDETQKSRKRKGKSALNELLETKKELDDAPLPRSNIKRRIRRTSRRMIKHMSVQQTNALPDKKVVRGTFVWA